MQKNCADLCFFKDCNKNGSNFCETNKNNLRQLKSETAIFQTVERTPLYLSASCRRLNKSWTKKDSPHQEKLCLVQLAESLENQLRHQFSSELINNNEKIIEPSSMNVKKFVDLTNKLLNMIGLSQQTVTTKNYIAKVPNVSLMLQFPGSVHKSWLKTVNALHSWPNVLAWFCWLATLAEAKTKAETLFQLETIPFVHREKRAILKVIIQCKRHHDKGEFDEEQKVLLDYMQEETKRSNATEQCLTELQSQLEQLEEKYLKTHLILDSLLKENQTLKQTVDYLKTEICKCDELLVQNKKQLEEQRNCATLKQAELALLEYAIEEKSCIVGQLEATLLKQQEYSHSPDTELEVILMSIMEKQNSLKHLDQTVSGLQERVSDLDKSIDRVDNDAQSLINSHSTELFISQDTNGLVNNHGLLQLLNEKDNYINSCKTEITTKMTNLVHDIEVKQNRLESLNEELRILDSVGKEMKEKRSSYKKEIDETRRKSKEKEKTLESAIVKLNQELKQIANSIVPSSELNLLYNQLNDKKLELKQLQEQKTQLKHKMKSFFETLLKCKSYNEDFQVSEFD